MYYRGLPVGHRYHGRDTISISEKAKLDGYYVEHQSIWMDLKCLFLTVLAVLRRDGVQEGAEKKVNDTPLVSVIMATYCRERELSCALESLARQTWKNQEIILVDDSGFGMECQSKKIVEGFQRRYRFP